MSQLAALLRLVASAILPGGGFFTGTFDPATVLALYWVDNLVGSVCMSVRLFMHRHLTGARGHYRAQIGATYRTGKGPRAREQRYTSFPVEFTVTSIVFVVAHSLFLAIVLFGLLRPAPDLQRLHEGASAIVLLQLGGLSLDLIGLRTWPFARIKAQALRLVGRIVLVHLAIIGGMVFFALIGRPWAFFSVFVILKFLSDLAGYLPEMKRDAPPKWLSRLAAMFPQQRGKTFDEYWKVQHDRELKQEIEDEKPVRGRARLDE